MTPEERQAWLDTLVAGDPVLRANGTPDVVRRRTDDGRIYLSTEIYSAQGCRIASRDFVKSLEGMLEKPVL